MTVKEPVLVDGWKDAGWVLPSANNLPCEVVLTDGSKERRDKVEGSWLRVVKWRSLRKVGK